MKIMPGDSEQILLMLGEIKGEVSGVNKRLDTINGRINKHDEQIASLNLSRATDDGSRAGIAKVTAVIAGSVSLIVTTLGIIFQAIWRSK
jgi:hypothetical protein